MTGHSFIATEEIDVTMVQPKGRDMKLYVIWNFMVIISKTERKCL
jgi:hypothetical protein